MLRRCCTFAAGLTLLVAAPAAAKTVTIGHAAAPDFVDPAIAYTQDAWQIIANAYTPLLTYAHEEGPAGSELVPGLAEALPTVSADGRTYSLKLRSGLRYANGKPVRARDFEHAIKRVLDLGSGGSAFFRGIAGARRYAGAHRPRGDISGIVTDDATGAITITLSKPDAAFAHVLAMPFASLVPSSTPFRNTTLKPPPGAAPYRIASVTGRGRTVVLRRDRRFSVPTIPAATVDRVVIRASRRPTRTGDLTMEATHRTGAKRFRSVVSPSTYYFFLNESLAPFDRPEVRRAVALAIDPARTKRIFGGLLEPSCSFLPPGVEGSSTCTQPRDLATARGLVDAAGVKGKRVTVYGNAEHPAKAATRYLASVLRSIGLKPRVRIVDASVYFQTIGRRKTRAQAGFANWFADFAHPRNFLFLVDSRSIEATHNQNFGSVDDAELDRLIDAGDWAGANARVADQHHVIAYGHRRLGILASRRIPAGCDVVHFQRAFDLARLCVR